LDRMQRASPATPATQAAAAGATPSGAEPGQQPERSQAPAWQVCVKACTRAKSDTAPTILNHIAKLFGPAALTEAAQVYTIKAIWWYGGKKRVLTDRDGHFLRLRKVAWNADEPKARSSDVPR